MRAHHGGAAWDDPGIRDPAQAVADHGQVPEPFVELGHLLPGECANMAAGRFTRQLEGQNLLDLRQGEPDPPRLGDELDQRDGLFPIHVVARWSPGRTGKDARRLVQAERPSADPGLDPDFPNQQPLACHAHTVNLALRGKVKRRDASDFGWYPPPGPASRAVDQGSRPHRVDDLTRPRRGPDGDILVFFHGYNVTFSDAARRAAQVAYDLDFPALVLFSWASRGSVFAYSADEENAAVSVESFMRFLRSLEGGPWRKVHVAAHSMGNRVVFLGLADKAKPKLPIDEMVMVAADINVPLFTQKFPDAREKASRFTSYISAATPQPWTAACWATATSATSAASSRTSASWFATGNRPRSGASIS